MFSSTPTRSLLLIPEHPSDFILLVIASEIISIIPTGYFNSTCESESVSQSVVSHSLRPHGLQPARLLSPWDSAGKNTGVGSKNFPDLRIEPRSPRLQADSSPSEPPG